MSIFLLSIQIFFIRIIDVSLGTFVTILTVKNKRKLATIIGFIDVLIWFLVVKKALNTTINSIWVAIAYASGYAVGTFIGTTLSYNLINGNVSIKIIMNDDHINDINLIRNNGFGVSMINCIGMDDKKKIMLFIETDRKKIKKLTNIVKDIDKKAFIIINDTRYVENGFFKEN